MEVFKYWLRDNNADDDEEVYELEQLRKFKSHNVIKERVELYKDFTVNLLHYIYDTYLGNDFINTENKVRGHFTWAFGKVLEEFIDEDINFYHNDDLYEYFYEYYKDQFYGMVQIQNFNYYHKFWLDIFDVGKNKPRKKFDILLQIYEIFDDSLIPSTSENLILI